MSEKITLPPANTITNAEQNMYEVELDPETKTTLHLHLYEDVKNVEEIRKNILSGSWKCVIIKPAFILDPLQIAVAANRAVLSEKNKTMTTRNVFTEILYNLSLTKNISQSLSKFGIEKDTEMFICFLVTPENDESKEILNKIEGKVCNMGSLLTMRDISKIIKVYKATDLKSDSDIRGLLHMVISRMATKNIISY